MPDHDGPKRWFRECFCFGLPVEWNPISKHEEPMYEVQFRFICDRRGGELVDRRRISVSGIKFNEVGNVEVACEEHKFSYFPAIDP